MRGESRLPIHASASAGRAERPPSPRVFIPHRGRPRKRWTVAGLLHLLVALCLLGAHPKSSLAYGTTDFPCPPELAPRVAFWVRIFSEFSTNQRVIHDARYPWIIYEVVPVEGMDQRRIKALVEQRKRFYAGVLQRLALSRPAQWNETERRVAALLADVTEGARYTRAEERIRSQPGIREQFEVGMRRSGRYRPAIEEILAEHGVPKAIACLPHVESSFYPSARSKAGAVGLWQFTGKTGRRFLRVEHDLDERLDPLRATEAAARYLLEAYASLHNWPLAVTAYNHGVGGMMKAKSRLGDGDVSRVLLQYDGPAYGFASQNFYCEFLAAIEVSGNAETYFGPLDLDFPIMASDFRLPDYVSVPALLKAFALTTPELAELNPALGQSYLQGSRLVPRGYVLHLPLDRVTNPATAYAALPDAERFDGNPAPTGYKVRPGDTLGQIAKSHRVSLGTLRRLNNIPAGDRIRPGQVLVLPDRVRPTL
jgi:membrane-bound lytic murein transglycosylase D